jgi:hypothetical protein
MTGAHDGTVTQRGAFMDDSTVFMAFTYGVFAIIVAVSLWPSGGHRRRVKQ